MNIKKAKEEVKNTVKAYLMKDDDGKYIIPAIRQRPMLLIGPPGIGKTQIMEQIARECRIGLVSYNMTHHTRSSAVGLPMIMEKEFDGKKYSVTEYTMSEIISSVYQKIEELGIREGILFIDEINCVSETLAPTMLQFLQCKTFGNQKIPEGWLIVAAGNPPEYNKSVREFDMVTLDRVRNIRIEADYDVWKEYARENHVSNAILSYLELRPQNFYKVETDVDGMEFVTARGWEDLSSLMKVYEKMDIPVDEEIIYEFLQHREIAKDVAAYIDLYNKYQDDYGIADILLGNASRESYERAYKASFDERLSVVNLLLSGLNVMFTAVRSKHLITDRWFEFLKEYRSKVSDINGTEIYDSEVRAGNAKVLSKPEVRTGNPSELYKFIAESFADNIKNEIKAGFYSDDEVKSYEWLADNITKTIITQTSPDKAFEEAKAGFDIACNELEELEEKAHESLEHAFDFMEDAFSNGQEMVVFVTELTMNKEAASFLTENTCERYLKYNEELMVGSRKASILSQLQKDEIYGDEHVREF